MSFTCAIQMNGRMYDLDDDTLTLSDLKDLAMYLDVSDVAGADAARRLVELRIRQRERRENALKRLAAMEARIERMDARIDAFLYACLDARFSALSKPGSMEATK